MERVAQRKAEPVTSSPQEHEQQGLFSGLSVSEAQKLWRQGIILASLDLGMKAIAAENANAIEAAISQASATRDRVIIEGADGAEVYAYPHKQGIAWGVNAAGTDVNILRGVRRPDGNDEAVSWKLWRTASFPAE